MKQKTGTLLRAAAVCFAVGMLFTSFVAADTPTVQPDSEAPAAKEGFAYIASDGTKAMFVNEENGSFYIQDKNTGTVWQSYPFESEEDEELKRAQKNEIKSALLVDYREGAQGIKSVNSQSGCLRNGALTIEQIEGGFRANYDFTELGFSIPVEYRLKNGAVTVSIQAGEIKESGENTVFSISVLPYFGAGSTKDTGYMLVPDGSGALIHFNNNKMALSQFSQPFYGADLALFNHFQMLTIQNMTLPVFGIHNPRQSMLGVISSGDADATLSANVSGYQNTYNNIYPTFAVRVIDTLAYVNEPTSDVSIYQKKTIQDKLIENTYLLIDNHNATYVDMANTYRTYLMANSGLKKMESPEYPLFLDVYNATILKKSFLGFPIDQIEVLTTYQQTLDILKKWKEKNADDIVLRLNNWSKQTVWQKRLNGSDLIGACGGASDFRALTEYADNEGIKLIANGSLNRIKQKPGFLFGRSKYATNIRGAIFSTYPYRLNIYDEDTSAKPYYYVAANHLEKLADQFLSSVKKKGFFGVSVEGSELLYTDFSVSNGSRETLKSKMDAALSNMKKQLPVALTNPPAYTAKYADYLFALSEGTSMFDIEDEAVPFAQIVYHGLIPYSLEAINQVPDPQFQFLKTLEYGAAPYYRFVGQNTDLLGGSSNADLFFADFNAWYEEAAAQYTAAEALLKSVGNQFITNHQKLADSVYQTTYEDGTVIVVNYTDQEVQTAYGTVSAMNYLRGNQSREGMVS